MVLIVKTTGCRKYDYINLAGQILNTFNNNHAYELNDNYGLCTCVLDNRHHSSNPKEMKMTQDPNAKTKKFRQYETENPFDKENPITVEVGMTPITIIVYSIKPINKENILNSVISAIMYYGDHPIVNVLRHSSGVLDYFAEEKEVQITGSNLTLMTHVEFDSAMDKLAKPIFNNAIIYDTIGLFKPARQLYLPTPEQICENVPNIISDRIYMRECRDVDYSVMLHHMNGVSHSHIGIDLCKVIVSNCSWENLGESDYITYYSTHGECAGDRRKWSEQNIRNIQKLYKEHKCEIDSKKMVRLNEPDGLCNWAGIPLFDYYYESQCLFSVRITGAKPINIVMCTQYCRYAHSFIRSFLGAIPSKNVIGYNDKLVNVVLKKSKVTLTDMIDKIQSAPVRELFHAIRKFGMVIKNQCYVVDPDQRKMYVGMERCSAARSFNRLVVDSMSGPKNVITFFYSNM